MAAGQQAAWIVLGNSIRHLLGPDEELVAFDEFHDRKQLRFAGPLFFSWLLITPDGIELTKKVAVAVTGQRMLIFEEGGRVMEEARKLIHEVPLSEVTDVVYEGGINLTRIRWSARGFQYEAAGDVARVKAIQRALERQPRS